MLESLDHMSRNPNAPKDRMAEYRLLQAQMGKKMDRMGLYRRAEKQKSQANPEEIGFVSQKHINSREIMRMGHAHREISRG